MIIKPADNNAFIYVYTWLKKLIIFLIPVFCSIDTHTPKCEFEFCTYIPIKLQSAF